MTAQPYDVPLIGRVQCHDCPEVHEAHYVGPNDYGQEVYNVVCGEYVERYTVEALLPEAPAPEAVTASPEAPADDAPTAPTYGTREEWLVAAVDALTLDFAAVGETVPAVRVSVGWPGGRGTSGNVIGQAWSRHAASDDVAQVFISPTLEDAVRVLDVLAHELVHVVDENLSGHKGRFAKIAKAIGLEGKMTATVAGDALRARLEGMVADTLGTYPHAALLPAAEGADGPKKQGTRMLKVECAEGSGYVVRMTRKWLDEYGEPVCPCHGRRMSEA